MRRDYNRCESWKQFGAQLITTEDLDPVYTMLFNARLEQTTLRKWLLAYWCFYSTATASQIAESPDFWSSMADAASTNARRGFERRHFRGNAAKLAVQQLAENSGQNVDVCFLSFVGNSAEQVAGKVKAHYMFGDWISWKIADMLERVCGLQVDFSNATLSIYKDPVQGAALIRHGDWRMPISDTELQSVVQEVVSEFSPFFAPPRFDRRINIQEAETILCKFKAHTKGFYPERFDTIEVRHALEQSESGLAKMLVQYLPGGNNNG